MELRSLKARENEMYRKPNTIFNTKVHKQIVELKQSGRPNIDNQQMRDLVLN
jgi:hypothetical protein